MAEPTGIILQAHIGEKALKKFLNVKQTSFEDHENWYGEGGLHEKWIEDMGDECHQTDTETRVSYFFAELLYTCNDTSGNVFLFNYDSKEETLFYAFIANHEYYFYMKSLLTITRQFARYKDTEGEDFAFIAAPTTSDIHIALSLQQGKGMFKPTDEVDEAIIKECLNRFWSFCVKNDFPEAEKALKKRNYYYYKPIKNAYKRYLLQREEVEKPLRIKEATKDNPYNLVNNIYTYDGLVFDEEGGLIEEADPFTFREVTNVSSIFADKNHVFLYRPVDSNKKEDTPGRTERKFCIMEGIDGASFTYVQDRWDTLYWKDKNHVYCGDDLKKMESADVKTFKYLDFAFGRDKNNIYYKDRIIGIKPDRFTLNKNGFIYDGETIYHYQNKIDMDAGSFKVISYESEVNPFTGTFILEDKYGRCRYEYKSRENSKVEKLRK